MPPVKNPCKIVATTLNEKSVYAIDLKDICRDFGHSPTEKWQGKHTEI